MAAQREWYEKDYYKVLGVKDDADAKAIGGNARGVCKDGVVEMSVEVGAEDRGDALAVGRSVV